LQSRIDNSKRQTLLNTIHTTRTKQSQKKDIIENLKYEQHEPHLKAGVNPGTREGQEVSASYKTI